MVVRIVEWLVLFECLFLGQGCVTKMAERVSRDCRR